MKKISLFLMLTASFGAAASPKVTITPLGDSYQPCAPAPQKATATASVIINEDFNLMKSGSSDAPDLENELAGYTAGEKIPTELTHGNQWTGKKVYSAGGTIALYTLNPQDAAYLYTPTQDLSGGIKVSFKTKCNIVRWEDEEGESWSYTGSSIYVCIGNDRNSDFDTSEGTISNMYPWLADIRLYEQQGWVEVEIEFDNYSAYNDAYIGFYCTDSVFIDDVKVTSSIDKFIAPPVISGINDLTETSVTVGFEPVRCAYNTYYYLLELTGHEDDGTPIYEVTMPQIQIDQILAELAQYGMEMTWEEYKEEMDFSFYNPYSNLGKVESDETPQFTIEGLDPAKDYFVGARSHYVTTFSEMAIIPIDAIAAPIVKEATGIGNNSFTANWDKVTKANSYEIDLYGVNEATEDVENYIIFEEDFENVSNYTDSTDIYDPEWIGRNQDITLDDLTTYPGWDSSENEWPCVLGKLGTMYWGAWIRTPYMYVGNSDHVMVSLKIEADQDLPVYLNFAGVTYEVPISGGVFEDEVYVPTNGVEESWLRLACSEDFSFFVDYLVVMQDLKKGDRTYTYLGTTPVEEGTSYTFSDLDSELFDMYGYAVRAVRGEDADQVKSKTLPRMLVDLKKGNSFSRVDSITDTQVVEVERYTIDGRRINGAQPGINIVRYSDGSVRKVMVK